MNNDQPAERQLVMVKIDSRDWQPATFQRGQFVDVYGLPLERDRISSWRPADSDRNMPG